VVVKVERSQSGSAPLRELYSSSPLRARYEPRSSRSSRSSLSVSRIRPRTTEVPALLSLAGFLAPFSSRWRDSFMSRSTFLSGRFSPAHLAFDAAAALEVTRITSPLDPLSSFLDTKCARLYYHLSNQWKRLSCLTFSHASIVLCSSTLTG